MANCLVAEGLAQQAILLWLNAPAQQEIKRVTSKNFFMVINISG